MVTTTPCKRKLTCVLPSTVRGDPSTPTNSNDVHWVNGSERCALIRDQMSSRNKVTVAPVSSKKETGISLIVPFNRKPFDGLTA